MPLVVLEGLDGAGKSTQIKMLRDMLESKGVATEYLHFPRFDAPVFGDLIARFLRGDLGKLEEVNPYLVALIYACDRADAAQMLRSWMGAGRFVILDRYVYSNIGYQCGKLPAGESDRLMEWILDLEYGYYKLPRPDVNIFLDVPFEFTKKKLAEARQGDDRDYLKGAKDIHEESLDLQMSVHDIYVRAAQKDPTLKVVDCSDGEGVMADPATIFKRIKEQLKDLI